MVKRLQPRKIPGQQRAVETRQRLLAAAARVFATHGYAAGTTNRIAEAAGHSIGSLYQYFPNKDAMLVELAAAHVRDGLDAFERHLARGLPPVLEDCVRLLVGAMIDAHRDDPALHRVLFEQAPRPPELLEVLREAEAMIVAAVAEVLAADPAVRVGDLSLAARLVVTTAESVVHRVVTHDPPDDLDAFADEVVVMLVGYLTAGGARRSGR